MDVRTLFPDCKDGQYGLEHSPGYDDLVQGTNAEIVIQVDDNDYQGDSRYLLRRGEQYGFLNIGWGSCPGCDWLQGCNTLQELQELADSIESSIVWFDTVEAARDWCETHDWQGDYSWHCDEQAQFVAECLKALNSTKTVEKLERGFKVMPA